MYKEATTVDGERWNTADALGVNIDDDEPHPLPVAKMRL
jgi:hypothetical protein